MLTADEILKQITNGKIIIEPFFEQYLGPNSYDLHLASMLKVYEPGAILDIRKKIPTKHIQIPPEGYVLQPGELYLGSTVEYTETHDFIPRISGRSSTGRYGIFLHVTAGEGDIGFCGHWTLEIVVVRPVRIYAGDRLGQIYYHAPTGRITKTYEGRYQNQGEEPAPSKMWM